MLERHDPFAPTLRSLEQDESLYPLAAWAYHHADGPSLSTTQREGLFVALERAWPQPKGQKKTRLARGPLVEWLRIRGWDTARIGQALHIRERTVDELEQDYRNASRKQMGESWRDQNRVELEMQADGTGHLLLSSDDDPPDLRPRVYADPVDPAYPEPFDPSTPEGKILTREVKTEPDWTRAEQFARADGDSDTANMLCELRLGPPGAGEAPKMSSPELAAAFDADRLADAIEADIERHNVEPLCKGGLWQSYRTKAEALRALRTLQDDPFTRSALGLRAYQCAAHKGWHLIHEWTTVARVEDLPEGHMLGAHVDGVDVLVANVHGEYRAIGAECTHAGCKLHEDGELDEGEGVVTCLCHGSVFDLQTGEAVEPPAEEAEPVYRVRVEGDQIQVAGPEA